MVQTKRRKPGERIPQSVRRKAVELAGTGASCRQIAAQLGVGRQWVSVVCKEAGHKFGAINIRAAVEASRAYGAERRAKQEARMGEELDALVERFRSPHLVYSFGGKDNTYEEHTLDLPGSRAVLDLSRACYSLISSMKLLHNYEGTAGGDLSAVDEFLKAMKGASE